MGKKQHSKDRMHLTATEWREMYGGRSAASHADQHGFKGLPFDACALSLAPFTTPMATRAGVVFDLVNIVPYVKRTGVNPVTGERLKLKELIKLNYHKNADGKYHDPVTFKIFSETSHIVAVAGTGNVYHYETIQQFNAKPNNWRDLLTEEPFTRADMITLQDPKDPGRNNYTKFYHMQHDVEDAANAAAAAAPKTTSQVKGAARQTDAIMKELSDTTTTWKKDIGLHSSLSTEASSAPGDAEHKAHYSTGEAAASFTSTRLNVRTSNTAATLEDEVVRYSKIKTKGYVALKTNVGTINLELHCDLVPRTCENFLRHCQSGYYKGTIFHRSIKHFMIQGGDPTGTGKGGESAFEGGKPFADEFKPQLSHKSRGIVSMANSGPNTNKSQFFMTYRPCTYLDKKHTVFAHVVGGVDTLANMERIETDADDRPKRPIKILDITVYQDPFQELVDAKDAEAAKLAAKEAGDEPLEAPVPQVQHGGVGKYIGALAASAKRPAAPSAAAQPATQPALRQTKALQEAKKVKKAGGFGDFSAW